VTLELEQAHAGTDKPTTTSGVLTRELHEVAILSPEGAVLAGFKRIERGLRGLFERNGDPIPRNYGVLQLKAKALELGWIDEATARGIDSMLDLRNLVAHARSASSLPLKNALLFLEIGDSVLAAFDREHWTPTSPPSP
jgi:hypothetical protein